MKNMSVFGIYNSRAQAENAVDALRTEGFHSDDVSALLPDKESSKEFATEKHTKAPEGTATGATTGAVLGGVLGWMAGIGALAIPGVGPLIAAGPIMGLLAGVGAGSVTGGLVGALVGMGIPEYEAKRYEGHVKDGGILLSVHCDTDDLVKLAKDTLKRTGAEDISSTHESGADHDATHTTTHDTLHDTTGRVVTDYDHTVAGTTTTTARTIDDLPYTRTTTGKVTEI